MLRGGFALTLMLALFGSPATSEQSRHPAVPVVEDLHGSMLETMKNADDLGYSGRYDKLAEALMASFDLAFMAQKAVGRNWKKFTPEEQAQMGLDDSWIRLSVGLEDVEDLSDDLLRALDAALGA